jgi:hypothetical protein
MLMCALRRIGLTNTRLADATCGTIRAGEDQLPTHPVLDGLGFSLRRRLRGGLGGAALGRPRPTGDLFTK